MTTTILRLPRVKERTGKSRSAIYASVAQGTFPPPINLGPRAVGWVEEEVEDWIRRRIETRRTAKR